MSIRDFIFAFEAPLKQCDFFIERDKERDKLSIQELFESLEIETQYIIVEKECNFNITFYV